jgi:hypothetical protein
MVICTIKERGRWSILFKFAFTSFTGFEDSVDGLFLGVVLLVL